MPFSPKIKEDALVNSRRCCCVCHEFSGRNTNVHHIHPESLGGKNTIDNAIVLCLKCHGEAGHYNPIHPIGNKYSPEELRRHRDEWWDYCEKNSNKAFPEYPISISPNSLRLVAGKWRTKATVKITNRTDEILYDVAVKFSIRVEKIKVGDIKIELPKRDFDLIHRISGIEFVGDLFRLNGIDSAGYEAFVLYTHHLDPHEVLSLVLTNLSSTAPSPQHNQHAVISLLGFETDPSVMLVQKNKAAVKFKSYEDWEVKGIELILKQSN